MKIKANVILAGNEEIVPRIEKLVKMLVSKKGAWKVEMVKTCKLILEVKEWTEVVKWTSAKCRAHQDLSESEKTNV